MSLGPRIFDELTDFQDDIERFFGTFNNKLDLYEEVNLPLTDLYESQNEFKIVMNLPGIKKKDIKIESDSESMEILINKVENTEKDKHTFHLRERRSGKIMRKISFPSMINPSKAKIVLQDGILTVNVPKAEESKKLSLKID